MEGEVMLDRRRRLNGLDLEGSTDIRKRTRTEGEGLRVVGLPSLVLGAKVECPGVLEVWGKDDRLVSSLPRELNTKIPRIQGHKGKFKVLAQEVFLGEGVKSADSIAEAAC